MDVPTGTFTIFDPGLVNKADTNMQVSMYTDIGATASGDNNNNNRNNKKSISPYDFVAVSVFGVTTSTEIATEIVVKKKGDKTTNGLVCVLWVCSKVMLHPV